MVVNVKQRQIVPTCIYHKHMQSTTHSVQHLVKANKNIYFNLRHIKLRDREYVENSHRTACHLPRSSYYVSVISWYKESHKTFIRSIPAVDELLESLSCSSPLSVCASSFVTVAIANNVFWLKTA